MLSQGYLFPQEAKPTLSSAPQISCDIGVISWCIARFDGSINMEDAGEKRVWKLWRTNGMDAGPLVIVENKSCGERSDDKATLDDRGQMKIIHGKKYQSTKYTLTTLGCALEFLWPADAIDKRAYKQTMLFGILVGSGQREQLYQVSARVKKGL